MRDVDTNILARLNLGDDPPHSTIAANVLESGGLFGLRAVMLKESVLPSIAEQLAVRVLDCLEHLVALAGITVEGRKPVEAATDLCWDGIDFAYAWHLCASSAFTELLTFDDRGVVRRAQELRQETRATRP